MTTNFTSLQIAHLLDGVSHVHLIGCGGAGMFPLIQILYKQGFELSGSDVEETKITASERELGMRISIGHEANNVLGAQLVVYSAAIHAENPERALAEKLGIPCVERSILLGYIDSLFPQSVGVAGTHGKTTTTGFITTLLETAGHDPAAVIGGKLPLIGGYGKAGSGKEIVIEACEYSRTFLRLSPTIAVLLNIDNDHLEYYGSMENLKAAFREFCELAQTVVYNLDCSNSVEALRDLDRTMVSFAIEDASAQYQAKNIALWRPGFYEFDLCEYGELLAHLKLNIPGYHNIYNALSMAAVGRLLDCSVMDIAEACEVFKGMGRRFEIKGSCHGAVIVDDYGHHPAEIKATLTAARAMNYKRLIAVHQPFTFSRTRNLLGEFVDALGIADQVVLLPIMGSREVNDGSVCSQDLANHIDLCVLVDGLESAAEWVKANCGEGDLVVCLSCGNLYKAADLMAID